MTQSTTAGFFTGGGRGITWPDEPGKDGGRVSVSGTITAIHPPEAVLDPKTGQPTERQQVRIELATDERDPETDFDDGARTLYVKSYMRGAIGDALRAAREKEPKIGGTLTVIFTGTQPPERAAMSPSKHFSAKYVPPAVTDKFFAGNGSAGVANSPAPAPAAPAPVRPATIPQAAWDSMDASTRIAVSNTITAMGAPAV
jgi:hypothetical protein